MKAILLAAGYATRLYPLTKDKPKPLLPVHGKPMIDYMLDEIRTIDAIDQIIVVTNHKFAEHFRQWAADKENVKILDDGTVSEDDRLGAIGDILFTLEQEDIDSDALITVCDNFFTYKLKDYYDFFRTVDRDCVIVKEIDDVETIRQFAVAVLDENGLVIDLEEKPKQPKSKTAVFGTYLYKRETLDLFRNYVAEGNNPDAPGHFPQWLYTRKEVYAYAMRGECYDIGTLKAYEEVQGLFKV